MKARWVFRGVGIAAIATTAVAVFGLIVKSLWNALLPSIFGWHRITFWQAIGLLLLSKILLGGGFRGFRGRGDMRWRWRRRMAERWERMSPEERDKFRHGMRGCFVGRDFQPGEQKI